MKLKLSTIDYAMLTKAFESFLINPGTDILESRRLIRSILQAFFEKTMPKVFTSAFKQKKHITISLSAFELLAFNAVLSEYRDVDAQFLPSYSTIHQQINQACLSI